MAAQFRPKLTAEEWWGDCHRVYSWWRNRSVIFPNLYFEKARIIVLPPNYSYNLQKCLILFFCKQSVNIALKESVKNVMKVQNKRS